MNVLANEVRFKPLRPIGERKPNGNIGWKFKDPEKQQARAAALESKPSFAPKPKLAPKNCPLCGTHSDDYRSEHNGEELLLPGGNPFICAVCGNIDWNI